MYMRVHIFAFISVSPIVWPNTVNLSSRNPHFPVLPLMPLAIASQFCFIGFSTSPSLLSVLGAQESVWNLTPCHAYRLQYYLHLYPQPWPFLCDRFQSEGEYSFPLSLLLWDLEYFPAENTGTKKSYFYKYKNQVLEILVEKVRRFVWTHNGFLPWRY